MIPMPDKNNISSSGIHVSPPITFSRGWRTLVWLNIFIQLFFPLVCSFTPAFAAVPMQHRVLFQQSDATQVYTLKSGESVRDVAQRYGITTDALHQLNQLRTFARGFDHLRAGDDIDVPARSLTGQDDGGRGGRINPKTVFLRWWPKLPGRTEIQCRNGKGK